MKLFQVSYDAPGLTVKAPGVSTTEVRRNDLFFAAETFEEVWEATQWIRDIEDYDFRSIGVVCDTVEVLK